VARSLRDRRGAWQFGAGAVLLGILASPFLAPDPPQPFKFLESARIRYVAVIEESGSPVCTVSYMLDGAQSAVDREAAPELTGWTRSKSPMESIDYTSGDQKLTIVGWNFGTGRVPMTHVLFERPATPRDIVRSWAYRVQTWLP